MTSECEPDRKRVRGEGPQTLYLDAGSNVTMTSVHVSADGRVRTDTTGHDLVHKRKEAEVDVCRHAEMRGKGVSTTSTARVGAGTESISMASFMTMLAGVEGVVVGGGGGGAASVESVPLVGVPDFGSMSDAQILDTLIELGVKWADAPKQARVAATVKTGGRFTALNFGRVGSLAAVAPLIAGVCLNPRPNVVGSGPGLLMPQWFDGLVVGEEGKPPYNPMAHPRVLRAHQVALLKDMVAQVTSTKTHLVTEAFHIPESAMPRVVLETCPLGACTDPGQPWAPWVSQNGTRVVAPAKIFIPEGPLSLLDMQMAQAFVNDCVGKARVVPGAVSIPCFVLVYKGDLAADADLEAAQVIVPWQVSSADGAVVVHPLI